MYEVGKEKRNIRELQTEHLCNIAKVLTIPDLQDESMWDKVDSYSSQILTRKGIYELKKLIRNEKKEKRDIIFSWITIITGLIGALIGLVSILGK